MTKSILDYIELLENDYYAKNGEGDFDTEEMQWVFDKYGSAGAASYLVALNDIETFYKENYADAIFEGKLQQKKITIELLQYLLDKSKNGYNLEGFIAGMLESIID